MPVRMALWKIEAEAPVELPRTRLNLESRLEDWIAKDPNILGLDLLIIGRQVHTESGGKIDLLAIDQSGNVIVLELKRDKTPRDIVAQVLDYASWVKDWTPKHLDQIAKGYLNESLDVAFSERFNADLPESLNVSHSMVIIASELDESSERIIQYLVDQYGMNINAIFFNFFTDDGRELLGRSWLVDPATVSETTEARKQPPWTGFWFVNVGDGESRSWEDSMKYGFLSAGAGRKYSDALKRLSVGDKIFAYQAGRGYVGYGTVTQTSVMAKAFVVGSNGEGLLDLHLKQPNMSHDSDDPDLAEWVIGVNWSKAVPLEAAKTFKGVFANQNVVCKLRHQKTFDFLKQEFGVSDDDESGGGPSEADAPTSAAPAGASAPS